MPASAARIAELRAELKTVRAAISEAYGAAAVGDDGRSLTRQRIDLLERREASLSWTLAQALDDQSIRRVPIDYLGA